MFAAALRSAYRTCDKNIVRNIRGKQGDFPSPGHKYVPKRPNPNPGLDNRIRAFEKDGLRVTANEAEEYVEQSESDFYKVGEVYNEHLNETLMGKYQLQHRIVKEKYFKENMPNLLTWSEKEQIRHLAEEQPDEWTLERLAESFPVTVPVIKKLLKFKWKPATEQRIARHDATVMRNWRELKEGSLDIPDDLRQHFLKFSNRTIPPLSKKSIAKIELTKDEELGEFAKIVQRCATQDQSSETSNDTNEQINFKGTDAKDKQVKKDPKRVTLDELTVKIKKRLEKGQKVDIPDKLMLNTIDSKISSTFPPTENNSEIDLLDEDSKEQKLVAFKDEEDKGKDIMSYPERIRIPKKAYKKGATYKVNDCYYDHDGRFLYRVLGMSNN